MSLRRAPVLSTNDSAISTWADDVVNALRQLQALPFVKGAAIEDVTTVVGTVKVPHRLGRAPLGYWVTNAAGEVNTWHARAPDDSYLYLGANAAVTVDLWVY